MIKEILQLGNPVLYETSVPVAKEELSMIKELSCNLHDTLIAFRLKYGAGRAIAAPQINVRKRVIYMYITEPVIFINPVLEFSDNEMMDVLDDCMSFPELFVAVKRYIRCTIKYKDLNWNDCTMDLDGDLSELLQHEYDHLDGILAVMRAKNEKSFYTRNTKHMYNI